MAALLAAAVVAIAGCTTGPMRVQQTHYLAVPSANDTNFYRIRVDARTRLGDAEFSSGWYPADAVDSAFGSVKDDTAGALKIRQDIKTAVNEAVLHAEKAYLAEAMKADADLAKIERLLAARKRVRAAPTDATPLPATAVVMEYDPTAGLVTYHVGDKLIFVLASDPDEVIGVISNFAQSQATSVEVTRLAGVISQQAANEVAATEAANEARQQLDALIAAQIQSTLEAISVEGATREDALQEIQTLRVLIEGLR